MITVNQYQNENVKVEEQQFQLKNVLKFPVFSDVFRFSIQYDARKNLNWVSKHKDLFHVKDSLGAEVHCASDVSSNKLDIVLNLSHETQIMKKYCITLHNTTDNDGKKVIALLPRINMEQQFFEVEFNSNAIIKDDETMLLDKKYLHETALVYKSNNVILKKIQIDNDFTIDDKIEAVKQMKVEESKISDTVIMYSVIHHKQCAYKNIQLYEDLDIEFKHFETSGQISPVLNYLSKAIHFDIKGGISDTLQVQLQMFHCNREIVSITKTDKDISSFQFELQNLQFLNDKNFYCEYYLNNTLVNKLYNVKVRISVDDTQYNLFQHFEQSYWISEPYQQNEIFSFDTMYGICPYQLYLDQESVSNCVVLNFGQDHNTQYECNTMKFNGQGTMSRNDYKLYAQVDNLFELKENQTIKEFAQIHLPTSFNFNSFVTENICNVSYTNFKNELTYETEIEKNKHNIICRFPYFDFFFEKEEAKKEFDKAQFYYKNNQNEKVRVPISIEIDNTDVVLLCNKNFDENEIHIFADNLNNAKEEPILLHCDLSYKSCKIYVNNIDERSFQIQIESETYWQVYLKGFVWNCTFNPHDNRRKSMNISSNQNNEEQFIFNGHGHDSFVLNFESPDLCIVNNLAKLLENELDGKVTLEIRDMKNIYTFPDLYTYPVHVPEELAFEPQIRKQESNCLSLNIKYMSEDSLSICCFDKDVYWPCTVKMIIKNDEFVVFQSSRLCEAIEYLEKLPTHDEHNTKLKYMINNVSIEHHVQANTLNTLEQFVFDILSNNRSSLKVRFLK